MVFFHAFKDELERSIAAVVLVLFALRKSLILVISFIFAAINQITLSDISSNHGQPQWPRKANL